MNSPGERKHRKTQENKEQPGGRNLGVGISVWLLALRSRSRRLCPPSGTWQLQERKSTFSGLPIKSAKGACPLRTTPEGNIGMSATAVRRRQRRCPLTECRRSCQGSLRSLQRAERLPTCQSDWQASSHTPKSRATCQCKGIVPTSRYNPGMTCGRLPLPQRQTKGNLTLRIIP